MQTRMARVYSRLTSLFSRRQTLRASLNGQAGRTRPICYIPWPVETLRKRYIHYRR